MKNIETIKDPIKLALLKLLIASLLLVFLIILCVSKIDDALRAIAAAFLFVLVLPINALYCIDASRVIASAPNHSGRLKMFGAILGIPQAILGASLLGIGIVYPFVGLYEVIGDLFDNRPPLLHLVWMFIAIAMLFIGYFYLRESLVLMNVKRRPEL